MQLKRNGDIGYPFKNNVEDRCVNIVGYKDIERNTRELKVYIPDIQIEREQIKLDELLEKKDEEVELKKLGRCGLHLGMSVCLSCFCHRVNTPQYISQMESDLYETQNISERGEEHIGFDWSLGM